MCVSVLKHLARQCGLKVLKESVVAFLLAEKISLGGEGK
jgi:hypothetical protein